MELHMLHSLLDVNISLCSYDLDDYHEHI